MAGEGLNALDVAFRERVFAMGRLAEIADRYSCPICPIVGTPAGISARDCARYSWGSPRFVCFSSGSQAVASGILRASFFAQVRERPHADRHNPDHSLPPLHGGHRFQTDDRL